MSRRILIAAFKRETHSFSRQPADLDAYRARALLHGEEIETGMRGTASEMAAFMDARDEYGWSAVKAVFADATRSARQRER